MCGYVGGNTGKIERSRVRTFASATCRPPRAVTPESRARLRLCSLHVSVVQALLLCATTVWQPVQAQSVTGTGDVVPAMPSSPLPHWNVSDSDSSGILYVGFSNAGTLNISGGGSVISKFGHIAGFIGQPDSVTGEAIVAGSGSSWVNTNSLTIGDSGTGTLRIESGGFVLNEGFNIAIGERRRSEGRVFVTGAGSLLEGETLYIGGTNSTAASGAQGQLTIENSGRVFSRVGRIGTGADAGGVRSNGTARVTGAGSVWDLTRVSALPGARSLLVVGDSADGLMAIEEYGRVIVRDTEIGSQESGAGRLEVNSGGLLETQTLKKGAGQGSVLLDGGTLRARFSEAEFMADFAPGDVTIGTGGAVIDSNGHNIGIGVTLSGAGGLEKSGSGMLTLSGSHAYTGSTQVQQGTLTVEGSIAGSALTVESGAILRGSGTVGDTMIADGGRLLLLTQFPVDPLTVDGNLTLASGAILNYELGTPGSTLVPGRSGRLEVTGDLALNGILNLSQPSDPGYGDAGRGYYRLMTYGQGLSGDGLMLGITPPLANVDYQVLAGDGKVDLFIAYLGDNSLQHWQGGDGTWNAGDATWLNTGDGAPVGEVPVAWAGHHAVFKNFPGGFDGGAVAVEGVQSFRSIQFVDEGYRLEGAGTLTTVAGGSEIRVLADAAEVSTAISGTGGIFKTEAGTLTLSGHNTYEGGTTLAGGTLAVSDEVNLGRIDGALNFDGGVLRITDRGFSRTDREVRLGANSGGVEIADTDQSFQLGGNITGVGDLIKRGEGELRLTGSNAYGNTLIERGRLVGDAGSVSGNIANAGVLVFDQTHNATLAGEIGGLGGLRGTMVKQGAGTLTLAGVSSLDWTVTGGGLATEAARFSGNVLLDGSASALTFIERGGAEYRGVISGNGRFSLDGAGTLRLSGDSSGFAGTTVIRGGRLLVGNEGGRGALGGSLQVLSGTTLGGHGTIGSGAGSTVTVATGGTLAPGNSLGTLTVHGDLVFDPGSRYAVEVNPAGSESDRVIVTGSAVLNGGTVAHTGADGNYRLRSTYNILSAGTLSGRFDSASSDFAFLTPDLLYDYGAGKVDMRLVRNDIAFSSAAQTRNQRATAAGIDTIGVRAAHPVYDAVALLAGDSQTIRASFDAFSGEIHASAKMARVEDSRLIRDAAYQRMRTAFHEPVAASAALPSPVVVDTAATAVWSQPFGSWGTSDSDGNASTLSRDTGGFLVGADRQVGRWRLGLLGGYSYASVKAPARGSTVKSDNYHLGLYAAAQWDRLALRTGMTHTWHDLTARRVVSVPGLADRLSATYRASTFQVFGELGYGVNLGAVRLEPFANIAHVRMHSDGYREQGGAAALSGHSDTMKLTFSTLGLRGEYQMKLGSMQATLRAMAGWRHAFGRTYPESTHVFSAGNQFTVEGLPIARDSAVIEAGLDLDLTSNASLGLSYTGLLSGSARDHGAWARLAVRF